MHGAGDRGASFGRVARRLPEYEVVTYDRRGYGASLDLEPASDIGRHAADLLAIVGDRPATVVGQSYGGLISLLAAAEQPRPNIVSVGFYEAPMPWAGWYPTSRDLPADPAELAEWFLGRVAGRNAWERLPDRERERRRAEGPALACDLVGARQRPVDPSDVLVPVLGAFGGAAERYERAARELVAAIPDAMLERVAGAPHGAHLTHPDAFADLVRAAVARADGQGPQNGFASGGT